MTDQERFMKEAIRQAKKVVDSGVVDLIREGVGKLSVESDRAE